MVDHQKLLNWLSTRILPYEGEVRAWLARALSNSADVEDILQEAYCRLSSLADSDGIENPRAYFFKTVRHVVIDEIRRAKVVRIETKAEMDDIYLMDDEMTPERVISARRELQRVHELIEGLPPRCREVFKLRKIEGLSQKEIALKMGITENTVENEASRGLKRILKVMAEDSAAQSKRAAFGFGRRSEQFRNQ